MQKVVIDTNCLISYVTDRNLKQQEIVSSVLEQAAGLKICIYCHFHVISEFIFVLDSVYGINPKDIRVMAQEFLSMPGVELISEVNTKTLFTFWPERIRDYGDAIIAATCRHIKGSAVLTFDSKFKASLKGLRLKIYQPYKNF
ncbi:MAG: type II toxin-antitoxin system VapC family toxin [Deltaproteobacteria bacterium]|nr:type II toxin-antitoxin system VapC family toxin [Deltaproteobacteria bacterium]MBW2097472.1 type II toxin-antitoxin system VapC family toxin [Deltaproteobacteria bacterium]